MRGMRFADSRPGPNWDHDTVNQPLVAIISRMSTEAVESLPSCGTVCARESEDVFFLTEKPVYNLCRTALTRDSGEEHCA